MSKTIQSCLSSDVLEQIERNDVSPDVLIAIEEHVSECPRCRELFDSHYTSSQWSELIQPALSEAQVALTSIAEDGADHSAPILKLLGPTDDPNMLGRIGNYEIVGVIGQGGMGAVFKGFDRFLNRFVAIKMLLPHLAASGAARKRFAREGQAVAAVVDDHVMAIHCVDQWQGIPYLVMTFSRGISLQKRLNDSGPLELREILRIGMQAAKGLAAAHAQGIVHRDIKPSNILLDQNVERVQLVDFGLARAVDDASLTCSGTLAGTPQYMSPEQARAEAVDHRSDLFSLGSVLYAMCAGYAPFRADSSYSVLRLIIEKEPRSIREINSDIPEWLSAIIAKLMSKSPDDRYVSAEEVATIFKQSLAHVQDPVQHALPPVTQAFKDRNQVKRNILSQLQRWFQMMNDRRIVSLIALILLLMAMLVPWPIATIASLETSMALAVPAALLSLGLALLSRTEYFSRIVLWIFGTALGVAVIGIGISVPIWMQRYSKAKVLQQEMEANDAAQSQRQRLDAEIVTQKDESQKRIERSNDANRRQTEGKAERIINGWPVPDTIVKPTFPREFHGNWRIQNAMTLTSKRLGYINQVAVIDENSLQLTSGEHSNTYRLSHWKFRENDPSIEVDLTAKSPGGNEFKTFRCLMAIHGNVLTLLRQQNEHFSRPTSIEDLSNSVTRFTLVREKRDDGSEIYSPLEAIEVAKRFANDDHGKSISVKFRVESVHPPFVPSEEDDLGHTKSELHLDFRPLPADFKDDQFFVVLMPEAIAQLNKLGISDIEKHFLHTEVEAQGRVLSTIYTARSMSGEHFHLIVSDLKQLAFAKEKQAQVLNSPSASNASASQQTLPTKDSGRSVVESIQEFCSILGIAEPRFLVREKAPHVYQIVPSEDIFAWRELVDHLNSRISNDTDAIEVKVRLAGVRRRMVDLLRAQVEFDLTQLLLGNPAWLDQGDKELSEAALETLRQRASEKLNELRSAAQKAALHTDLHEQRETAKSESLVTPFPMKFVSSQKAQATILNTSRLFGILPEMPASDIRSNMLIIEKNGREKYFTCLAETLDRSSQESAMSFDERIELWENRLRLLEILRVAVGAES